MKNLHEHYDRLSEAEKGFVDHAFYDAFAEARRLGIPLMGDDRAERAVDALARLVIESRAPGFVPLPWETAEAGRDKDTEAFQKALQSPNPGTAV